MQLIVDTMKSITTIIFLLYISKFSATCQLKFHRHLSALSFMDDVPFELTFTTLQSEPCLRRPSYILVSSKLTCHIEKDLHFSWISNSCRQFNTSPFLCPTIHKERPTLVTRSTLMQETCRPSLLLGCTDLSATFFKLGEYVAKATFLTTWGVEEHGLPYLGFFSHMPSPQWAKLSHTIW